MFRFLALGVAVFGALGAYWVYELKSLDRRYPWVSYDAQTKKVSVKIKTEVPPNWVKSSSISPALKSAIILSEDSSFYDHEGIDPVALEAAIEEAWKKRKLTRGASTIPMQLIKNLYFSNSRSLIRKALEIPMSWTLDRYLSKQRILELYLNVIEYGEGVYGIGQATRHYFRKAPSQITPKEAAFLAMLLPSPKKYAISFRRKTLTPFAKRQIRLILWKLRSVGRISDEAYQAALVTPLSFEAQQVAQPAIHGVTNEANNEATDDETETNE